MNVREYIETVFTSLPESTDKEQLKEQLILDNNEKYKHLVSQGMSHEEALGQIISEFGSLDDLREILRDEVYDNEEFVFEEPKKKKKKKRMELYPIAGVLYLIMGIFFDLWHPGWIIFSVAFVLDHYLN